MPFSRASPALGFGPGPKMSPLERWPKGNSAGCSPVVCSRTWPTFTYALAGRPHGRGELLQRPSTSTHMIVPCSICSKMILTIAWACILSVLQGISCCFYLVQPLACAKDCGAAHASSDQHFWEVQRTWILHNYEGVIVVGPIIWSLYRMLYPSLQLSLISMWGLALA